MHLRDGGRCAPGIRTPARGTPGGGEDIRVAAAQGCVHQNAAVAHVQARRIRREHKVPAVIYGHGNDPVHVTLPGHETMMALKHHGQNALLELTNGPPLPRGDAWLMRAVKDRLDPRGVFNPGRFLEF